MSGVLILIEGNELSAQSKVTLISLVGLTWVVKTCLCLQHVITELEEMYSDLNFYRCTFHVHGKCRSGSILGNHNLKTLYPANLIQPNLTL